MKKIYKVFGLMLAVMLLNIGSIQASSYNMILTPQTIKAKPGETIEIKVGLSDIDMGEKGINTVEGYIKCDEDIIEKIEVENENDWNMSYNTDKSSELYGKFLSLKEIVGIKEDENIAKLKVKIKDKINKEKGEVKLEQITSNDGEKLINIGERTITIEFDKADIKVVNTGDIIPVIITLLVICILGLNIILILKRKNKQE